MRTDRLVSLGRVVRLFACAAGGLLACTLSRPGVSSDGPILLCRLSDPGEAVHHWLSDREVLILSSTKTGGTRAARVLFPSLTRDPLAAFNRRFAKRMRPGEVRMTFHDDSGRKTHKTFHRPPRCAVSPDGKWLLWKNGSMQWIAARWDASRSGTWIASSDASEMVWKPDNVTWIEIVSQFEKSAWRSHMLIHSRHDMNMSRKVALPRALWDGILIGVTGNNRVLFDISGHGGPAVRTTATLVSLELVSGTARSTRHTVALPAPLESNTIVLSPDRRSLAWYMLNRPGGGAEYWTSTVDGRNLRKVGFLEPAAPLAPGGGRQRAFRNPGPGTPQWTPDGTRLTVIYRDALWAFPVTEGRSFARTATAEPWMR